MKKIGEIFYRTQNALPILLLLLVVILSNLSYFTHVVWDVRDTTSYHQVFHFFYTELYFERHVPQWIPYLVWGHPAQFVQLNMLSSVETLTMLMGVILRVENSFFLWKVAMLGEQMIFTIGLYVLAKHLFTRKTTVWIVCCAASGSLVWYWHSYLNLRPIYLLPLILYLICLFFSKQRPHYLWVAGITVIVSGIGLSYFLIFTAFTVTLFFLLLFFYTPSAWKFLFEKSRLNAISFTLFILVAGIFVYSYKTSLETITTLREARTESGAVSLDTFLHFHGTSKMMGIAEALLSGNARTGVENDYQNNLYIGLFPLFLAMYSGIWGISREKRSEFWAISSVTLVLIAVSFGGLIGSMTYWFPFMKFTRYIRWLYSYVKVFLALLAGFGFEHLLTPIEKRQKFRMIVMLIGLTLLLFDATLSASSINILVSWNKPWPNLFFVRAGVYFSLIITALCGNYLYERSFQRWKLLLFSVGIIVIGSVISLLAIKILSPWNYESDGLLAKYYPNMTWTPPLLRKDIIADFSKNSDFERVRQRSNNQFSVEWTGAIKIASTDNYIFFINSDDGAWLWIDDTLVVDNGGVHGLQEKDGAIYLERGVHKIRIRYLQAGGEAILRLFWANSHISKTVLPEEVLLSINPLISEKAGIVLIVGGISSTLLLLILFFFIKKSSSQKRAVALLTGASILGLVFDLASYQYIMSLKFPKLDPAKASEFLAVSRVEKVAYQRQRSWQPETERQMLAFQFKGEYPFESLFTLIDQCLPTGNIHTVTRDVKKIFQMRSHDDEIRSDPVRLQMIGCETPKLQVIDAQNAIYVANEKEALNIATSLNDLSGKVIIETEKPHIPQDTYREQNVANVSAFAEVVDYNSDRILIQADVASTEGAWLVYADAYHPNWRAMIDGKDSHIYRTNVAFKAVKLSPGKHTIEFVFGTWKDRLRSYFLWYFGAFWIVGVCGWSGHLSLTRNPEECSRNDTA